MGQGDLIGAMEVVRCPECAWMSPVFRTPLSEARRMEIDLAVADHTRTHAAVDPAGGEGPFGAGETPQL
jgi:hypothetical protein